MIALLLASCADDPERHSRPVDPGAVPCTEPTGFADADGDGFGATPTCEADAAAVGGDCDDGDGAVHPGAEDVCDDGVDQDCDGRATCGLAGSYALADRTGSLRGPSGSGYFWYVRPAGDPDGDGVAETFVRADAFGDFRVRGMPTGDVVITDFGEQAPAFPDAVGDFDGDGTVDGIVRAPVDDDEEVVLWSGTATAPASVAGPALWSGSPRWFSIQAGDLDGDGRSEAAFTFDVDDTSSGVWLVRDLGAVTALEDAVALEIQFDPTLPTRGAVLLGDITGDGVGDLGVAQKEVAWVVGGTASGVVDLADADWRLENPDGYATLFAVGDLDGDGLDDLGASDGTTRRLHLFTDGARVDGLAPDLATATWFGPRVAGPFPSVLVGCGDPDLDGLPDLAGKTNDGPRAPLYLFSGAAQGVHDLEADSIATVADVGWDVRCEDLDGDGVLDLLWTDNEPSDPEALGLVWIRSPGL